MRWFRKHKGQAMAVAAMAVGGLVMVFAIYSLLFNGSEPTATSDQPLAEPSLGAPLYVEPDDLALTDKKAAPGLTTGGIPSFKGAGLDLKGLQGEGGIVGIPKHTIVLSMKSAADISYVGYVVPSSLTDGYGVVKNLGTSWSLTTTGYGPPDYAQLFSIAGPAGVPVTCTITVDGKVTEKRTTSGPYDQLFCQG